MERIFPNLYRFDFVPKGKDQQMSHSYLIVRKEGNLLVCHCKNGSPVTDYLDEIESLGGIDTQFVAHFHDAKRGDLHDVLYERFGCKLCYHEAEHNSIRTKTKCPEIKFDNNGLKLGSDFEAHYFPGHTPGMSIFRWKHRGKHFLFPSHVITHQDDEWSINWKPHLAPKQKSQFSKLAKMEVDYWMGGGSPDGTDACQKLSTASKKNLLKSLQEKLNPPTFKSNRPRIVTGAAPWIDSLREADIFDIETITGFVKAKTDTLEGYLDGTDVMFFLNYSQSFATKQNFLNTLRQYVEQGGSLLIGDSRPKTKKNWIVSTHPFPEISAQAIPATSPQNSDQQNFATTHPILKGLPKKIPTLAQVGMTFEPGEKGTPILHNEFKEPVCIVGQVGKGRVMFIGFYYYGSKTLPNDIEKTLLQKSVGWLAKG